MSADRWEISRRTVLTAAASGIAVSSLPISVAAAAPREASAEPAGADLALPGMETDAQWSDFLSKQDLIWKRLPKLWHEGPFLGDGRLGTLIYAEPGKNSVRFTVQHAEVQDHRPQFGSAFGVCRLPVGHLTLEPAGKITGVDLRLDLWDAELTGSITTDRGRLTVRAYIHTTRSVLVVAVTPSSGERVRWVFHPAKAISPAAASKPLPDGYQANPAHTTTTTGDVKQVLQALRAGGQTATAYREIAGPDTGQRVLYVSVAHSFPGTGAANTSLNAVRTASEQPLPDLTAEHRRWWHAFYRKSFVSFPDQRLQSFHWIQLYKVASGSRAGGPVMATTGPWLETTPWPAVWWNLNVQLEYWLIHGSNHHELDAITSTVDRSRQQLINNVKSQYRSDSAGVGRSSDMFCTRSVGEPGKGSTVEAGDLPWALHNVWLSYRHTMDDTMLREVLFPLLRRAINYYLHFLKTGSGGKLHLPTTHSPEYGDAPDCNYDLALIRWGCQALIDAANRLRIDDPLLPKWRSVLRDLVPYPTNANGFMVGTGVPFAKSHRHYSHLLMVYPLHLVNWDQAENRSLIEKSLNHWQGLAGAHRGYSYTGAASISAQMGRGNDALRYLMEFFDTSKRFPPTANTMYTEAGPVVETPLSASQSLLDMFVQSWGGVIRVFPAVPSAWKDVTVHNHRAQGAFLLSAVRKGGATRFVRLRSLAGERCRVRTGIGGSLAVTDGSGSARTWREVGSGVIEIDLPRDGEALIHAAGPTPDLTIAPVATTTPGPAWGLP